MICVTPDDRAIDLLLQGCDRCWSFYLFSSLSLLGVVQRDAWDIRVNAQLTSASVRGICLPEEAVKIVLTRQIKSRWNAVVADPRTAPSLGVERCTHAAWVRPVDAAGIGRPKHLTLWLPFKQLQCLASFRVGWHHLEVHSGRLKHPTVPRADRLCKLCSVGGGRFIMGRDLGRMLKT
jgi:hypothetical protein